MQVGNLSSISNACHTALFSGASRNWQCRFPFKLRFAACSHRMYGCERENQHTLEKIGNRQFVPGWDAGWHTHPADGWIVGIKGAYLYNATLQTSGEGQ